MYFLVSCRLYVRYPWGFPLFVYLLRVLYDFRHYTPLKGLYFFTSVQSIIFLTEPF